MNKIKYSMLILAVSFVVIFAIGFIGYKFVFGLETSDAIFNTALTISNTGIGLHEKTASEKIFTAMYSIITCIFFVSLVSSIVAFVFSYHIENVKH